MDPANMLSWARHQAGLSQRDLAERAGVPQSTVGRIESGAIDPRARMMDRLLRVCSFELDAVPREDAGVDRSLIRMYLEMTPRQRIESSANVVNDLTKVRAGRRLT